MATSGPMGSMVSDGIDRRTPAQRAEMQAIIDANPGAKPNGIQNWGAPISTFGPNMGTPSPSGGMNGPQQAYPGAMGGPQYGGTAAPSANLGLGSQGGGTVNYEMDGLVGPDGQVQGHGPNGWSNGGLNNQAPPAYQGGQSQQYQAPQQPQAQKQASYQQAQAQAPQQSAGPNPYIAQQAKAIQDQSNLNLKQNILPGIGQSAMGAGQYGGTRQGIAQGVAAGNAQAGIAGAQANLYGNAYESDQNRGLQQQQINNAFNLGGRQIDTTQRGQDQNFGLGMGNLSLGNKQADNSFGLGLGNLALGGRQADNSFALGNRNIDTTQRGQDQNFGLGLGNLAVNNKQADNTFALGNRQADNTRMGQDQNFYTQQRGQDLSSTALGASLFGQGNTGNLGIGAGQYGLGRDYMYSPMDALGRYSNTISPYSGLNSTQTRTDSSGGGAQGMIGGALAGGQFANNLGFGGQQNQYQINPYTGFMMS